MLAHKLTRLRPLHLSRFDYVPADIVYILPSAVRYDGVGGSDGMFYRCNDIVQLLEFV